MSVPRVLNPRLVEQAPRGVAAVTLVAGLALLLAPDRTAAAARLPLRPTPARAVGVLDLALVPGLLKGRPRWPWMVARGLANLVIAGVFRTEARRAGGAPRATAAVLAMVGLTAMDLTVAAALRTAEQDG